MVRLTKQQVLSQKCPTHPTQYLIFLNLGNKMQNIRICGECANVSKIQKEELVLIEDILNSDYKSSQRLFPIYFNSDISDKLKQIQEEDQQMLSKISFYFQRLKERVQNEIELMLSNQKKRLLETTELLKQCDIKSLQKVEVNHIQQILLSPMDYSNQDLQLNSCITSFLSKISSEKIESLLQNLADQQISYSLELTDKIKPDLVKLIQSLSFWTEPSAQQEIDQIKQCQILKSKLRSKDINKQRILLKFIIEKLFFKQLNQKPKIQDLSILQWLPSLKHNDSSNNLKIQQRGKQIEITNISSERGYRQCYFLPELELNKNYLIQLSLTNSYDNSAYFEFGLLDSQHRDDWSFGLINNEYAYYKESNGGECNKVLKGQKLHSNRSKKIGLKKLEFRLNLSERLFKVTTLPEFENIVELDKKEYIKDKSYVFAFTIYNPGDSVTVQQILEVNSFEKQMF